MLGDMERWIWRLCLDAFTYLCNLLGCSKDVPQGNMGGGNSQSDDNELDFYVMAYLQVSEVLVGLTKEKDQVVCRAKQFQWEGNSLL